MPTLTPEQMDRLAASAKGALDLTRREGVSPAQLAKVSAEEREAARKREIQARLSGIAAKMQSRREKGLAPPNVPFVEAALSYDVTAPRPERKSPEGGDSGAGTEQSTASLTPQPRGRGGRRLGPTPLGVLAKATLQPGFMPKEESRFAYASGENYTDRRVPPERERGEE